MGGGGGGGDGDRHSVYNSAWLRRGGGGGGGGGRGGGGGGGPDGDHYGWTPFKEHVEKKGHDSGLTGGNKVVEHWRPGMPVVVQVTRLGSGHKGPRVTARPTLPGRSHGSLTHARTHTNTFFCALQLGSLLTKKGNARFLIGCERLYKKHRRVKAAALNVVVVVVVV